MKLKVFLMITVTVLDAAFYASLMRGTQPGQCIFARFAAHGRVQLAAVRQ